MPEGKPYTPPRLVRHDSEADYPDWARNAVKSIRQEFGVNKSLPFEVKPEFITVADCDGKYVDVSDGFCQLLGYRRDELIGKSFGDLTAPNTTDIPTVFKLFSKLGYMHGLWMLVSRRGTRVLVRYEAWIRPDSRFESRMEIVGAGY
jgi:PAS domain S-box-containing protein